MQTTACAQLWELQRFFSAARCLRVSICKSMYFFTKGENASDGHLEVLKAPWNAHYSNAEKQPANKVDDGNLPPSQENPDEVHHDGQAARLIRAVHQLMAKRPEGVGAQLEELDAKRNADNADTHQQPYDVVYNGDKDTAEDEPEYVAD